MQASAGTQLAFLTTMACAGSDVGSAAHSIAPTFTQCRVDIFIKEPKALDAFAGQHKYVVDSFTLAHVAPAQAE